MDKHSPFTHPPEKEFVGLNKTKNQDKLLAECLAMLERCRGMSFYSDRLKSEIYKLQVEIHEELKNENKSQT